MGLISQNLQPRYTAASTQAATAAAPYGNPGQTFDPTKPPTQAAYTPLYDPNTMSLSDQMQKNLSGTHYNQGPLKSLEANAYSTQASPWAQMQSQLARNQTQQAQSGAANQVAGSTAQAQGNLAMSGGLSSGAAERAQTAGQAAGINAQQGIANQGNQAQLGIGAQDATQKLQMQQALPGEEAQAYSAQLAPVQLQGQAQAQDVAHQMADAQGLNNYNMGIMGLQGNLYGSNQNANAAANTAANTSGLFGGGGTLGLGQGSGWDFVGNLGKDSLHYNPIGYLPGQITGWW